MKVGRRARDVVSEGMVASTVRAIGRVVAAGSPSEVVTPQLVRDVFGLEARVIVDPVARTPLVVPVGRHHR